MPDNHRIQFITRSERPNPHERITHIGGVNEDGTRWKISHAEAIDAIENDKWRFFVIENDATVWVIVAVSGFGRRYLKTEYDREQPINLLKLPECP